MITKKETERLLSLRDSQINKEKIKFDLKVVLYVVAFICGISWIRILHVYYVVPRCGGGTDFGIAYGAFTIVLMYICSEAISERKSLKDYRIEQFSHYYNNLIYHSEAMRLAYKSMNIDLVDEDDIELEEIPVDFSNDTDYEEDFVNDFEFLSEDDFTDEELGIEV